MVLLSLQMGVQPVLFTECVDKEKVSIESLVFGQEILKAAIALCMFLFEFRGKTHELPRVDLRDSIRLAAVPATLYAIQNILCVLAYRHLDFITFHLLNQTKLLTTAVVAYFILGQRQSPVQCGALLMVFSGAVLLTIDPEKQDGATGTKVNGDISSAFWKGTVPLLMAAVTSGLASGLSQFALQKLHRNSFLYSAELAVFAIFVLPLVVHVSSSYLGQARMLTDGLWGGWTPLTAVPVLTQAMGGIFVVQVTKQAGGVWKNFCSIFGILTTSVLQLVVYKQPISQGTLVAAPLVVCAMLLHSTFPSRPLKAHKAA